MRRSGRGARGVVAGTLALVLFAGCAGYRPPSVVATAEQTTGQITQDTRECEASVPLPPVARALGTGAAAGVLAALYLALRGAAEGVWWGALTGASKGDGAWIGAAAGAGVGLIIGSVVGVKDAFEKDGTAWASRASLVEQCLAERGYQLTRQSD